MAWSSYKVAREASRAWALGAVTLALALVVGQPSSAVDLPPHPLKPDDTLCFMLNIRSVNVERNPTLENLTNDVKKVIRKTNPQTGLVAPVGGECFITKTTRTFQLLNITVTIQSAPDQGSNVYVFQSHIFSFSRSRFPKELSILEEKVIDGSAIERTLPSRRGFSSTFVNILEDANIEMSGRHILKTLGRLNVTGAYSVIEHPYRWRLSICPSMSRLSRGMEHGYSQSSYLIA